MDNGVDESSVTQRFYRARDTAGLGRAVQGVRTARRYTQDELAHMIDSSRPTISRLERGAAATSTDTLLDALAACGYELVVVPRGARITVTS